MSSPTVSRRGLLSGAALVGTTLATQNISQAANNSSAAPEGVAAPQTVPPGPDQFFSADEVLFIDAAAARLIPKDDLGAGAKEAGVTVFIDRQLAGSFGKADTWYMRGPWAEGSKSQGYQTRM